MNQQNKHLRFVCKINLYTDGNIVSIFMDFPENPNTEKRFYNSLVPGAPTSIKHNRTSLSFNEEFKEDRAGGYYEQQIQFRFRSNTEEHALESEFLKKVKLIGLVLSDGTETIIGRNDVKQNRKPALTFSSDLNFTEVRFTTKSIIPASLKNIAQTGYAFTYPFVYLS